GGGLPGAGGGGEGGDGASRDLHRDRFQNLGTLEMEAHRLESDGAVEGGDLDAGVLFLELAGAGDHLHAGAISLVILFEGLESVLKTFHTTDDLDEDQTEHQELGQGNLIDDRAEIKATADYEGDENVLAVGHGIAHHLGAHERPPHLLDL